MSKTMNMVLAMLLLVVVLFVGSAILLNSIVFGSVSNDIVTKDIGEFKNSRVDGTHIYLYVFNDKTQAWDRAREETLRSSPCNRLHGYSFYEESK